MPAFTTVWRRSLIRGPEDGAIDIITVAGRFVTSELTQRYVFLELEKSERQVPDITSQSDESKHLPLKALKNALPRPAIPSIPHSTSKPTFHVSILAAVAFYQLIENLWDPEGERNHLVTGEASRRKIIGERVEVTSFSGESHPITNKKNARSKHCIKPRKRTPIADGCTPDTVGISEEFIPENMRVRRGLNGRYRGFDIEFIRTDGCGKDKGCLERTKPGAALSRDSTSCHWDLIGTRARRAHWQLKFEHLRRRKFSKNLGSSIGKLQDLPCVPSFKTDLPEPQGKGSRNLPSPVMPAERSTREKADPKDIILVSDGEDDFPPVEVHEAFLGYMEKRKAKSAKEQKQRHREKKHNDLLKQLARAEKTNEQLTSALASLKEFANCGICFDLMEDPTVYSKIDLQLRIMCGHVFCRSCISLEAEFQGMMICTDYLYIIFTSSDRTKSEEFNLK
ncbi:hypothetical protein HYPSUDRAFT_59018 [Hypholoma sublateritium FD-334 SS-4]|uniref:RING-type domain-containing protein n=1 Tax=Hypholoma sublateritium (strain FD-334 SS-4) TaxID=945553 RepID=A0A0D2N7E9_HYPSF|nr:hypothetical protein HYPSUDRAFT_59018 [Hypholoma sublateritium FD-334 SS-4]